MRRQPCGAGMDQPLGNRLSAVLFDLDGTLANTDPIHYSVWKLLMREFGMEIDRDFYDAKFSGRLNAALIQELLPQLSDEEKVALSHRKEALFRQEAQTTLTRLAGLSPFLDWVERQQLKRAVVTNAPTKNVWFSLDTLKLREFFEVVVIAEDLPHGKPHPMPYEVGLHRIGAKATESIAFEDSPSGIRSAVAAGLVTVGVASTHDPDSLSAVGASAVITDFTDPTLMTILNQRFAQTFEQYGTFGESA